MASLSELEASNPNIREQLKIWQRERIMNAQDPYVYEAFRQHVLAIGAPDPGEQEFDDFRTPEPVQQAVDISAPEEPGQPARRPGPVAE